MRIPDSDPNQWMTKTMTTRSYSELARIDDFRDRFNYLVLGGRVGETTFGFDRHVNQLFYRSAEWRRTRRDVIARDLGCDLGVDGYDIHDRVLIHHMNPMRVDDIIDGDMSILDPEYLISTTLNTHNAIHYGDESLLPQPFVERSFGDTRLW